MRKTKLTFILLITVLTLAIMPTSVFALEGSGTAAAPFIVSSEADLRLVGNDMEAHYKLGGNINLASAWSPIGDALNPFKGVFDGNGYTIDVNIVGATSGTNTYDSLFGVVDGNGKIKNLTVTGKNHPDIFKHVSFMTHRIIREPDIRFRLSRYLS